MICILFDIYQMSCDYYVVSIVYVRKQLYIDEILLFAFCIARCFTLKKISKKISCFFI